MKAIISEPLWLVAMVIITIPPKRVHVMVEKNLRNAK